MDYKAEFTITLPDELLDALGIDEDTIFEAFYEDGKIKVRPLDEADPIEQAYNLQVQSPGIERELCRDFHFECYLGEKIQVRLIKAFEGKREYKGILIDYDNDSVTIAIDEETEMNILKKEASWIKADDFGGIGSIDE